MASPKKESLFSRTKLHDAGWQVAVAIISALIIGVGASALAFVYGPFKPKEQVVITTPNEGATGLLVRIERPESDPAVKALEEIAQLTKEAERIRKEQAEPAKGTRLSCSRPKLTA